MASPFGGVITAGKGSQNLVSTSADGATSTALAVGGAPFRLAPGPDGEVWVTDQDVPRVLRTIDRAPRVGQMSLTPTGVGTAVATVSVDTGGNDTTVAVSYEAGQAVSVQPTPAAAGVQTVRIGLGGLPPGAPVRLRATVSNARGAAAGDPVTVVTGLKGAETIKLRCSAKRRRGCPFRAQTVKVKQAGTRNPSALFGRKHPFRPGARLTVTISAKGERSRVITVTIRKGMTPEVKSRAAS